jgi:hypothetical protein
VLEAILSFIAASRVFFRNRSDTAERGVEVDASYIWRWVQAGGRASVVENHKHDCALPKAQPRPAGISVSIKLRMGLNDPLPLHRFT